jgi:hypothetical protein
MVSKCANPACFIPLLRLREGKLFQFDSRWISGTQTKPSDALNKYQVTHYWLCGECAAFMTLRVKDGSVEILPLKPAKRELSAKVPLTKLLPVVSSTLHQDIAS